VVLSPGGEPRLDLGSVECRTGASEPADLGPANAACPTLDDLLTGVRLAMFYEAVSGRSSCSPKGFFERHERILTWGGPPNAGDRPCRAAVGYRGQPM
jgi:hypothetical protein